LPIFWALNAGEHGAVLAVQHDGPGVAGGQVGDLDVPAVGGGGHEEMDADGVPAVITSGWELVPSNSSALNAAVSAKLLEPTCHTGVHTENLFGA
jgi:hypothetical protein